MVYIRKATSADAERIRFIAEQCWWFSSENIQVKKDFQQLVKNLYSYGTLGYQINHNISIFLLVVDQALAVAFASYTFNGIDKIVCEINAIYCLPETQGKRFDELLIIEIIRNTVAVGGNKIFVVFTNYKGPVGLFKRLGFSPYKNTGPEELPSQILVRIINRGKTTK